MSVATELTKLNTNIKNAYDEIQTKGGTIPQNKNTDNLATAINSIPAGGGSPDDYFYTNNTNNMLRDMIKKVPDITTTATSLNFAYFTNLLEVGNITALNCTSLSYTFDNCTSLTTLGTLSLGTITTTQSCFSYCTSLETAPFIDTSSCTNFSNMFNVNSNLKYVPVYNMSSATNLNYVFNSCGQLTDEALDNIMQSLATATSYTGNKYMRAAPGITNSISSARIQACPHYQDANALGFYV